MTVLITTLAVFLAYNANSGLPFVPTYTLSAEVPDAETLVPGNEVRVGGVRVGQVVRITPQAHQDGSATAKLDLELDRDIQPLPKDSTYMVRSRSALGLKYLELVPGDSEEGWERGSIIPVSQARPEPVELDEVLNTFDEPTRAGIQGNLLEFGSAIAGRGPDLNRLFGVLPDTLDPLRPVMANLSSDDTRLGPFFQALAQTAAEVAPVAQEQAEAFVNLDTTFAAFADVSIPYIQDSISKSPPTLRTVQTTMPTIRPFLDNSARLFADLRPGARAFRENGPAISRSLELGSSVLLRAPAFNRQLPKTARALERLNDDSGARAGINRLEQTNSILKRVLAFVTPAQTVCNYGGILARNIKEVYSRRNSLGTFQQFIPFAGPEGPDSLGRYSARSADGGGEEGNFLHYNPYPNTAAPGQTRECEAGREPYLLGRQVIGNVPGNQGTEMPSTRGSGG
ncbi:MCE family protein [Thermoleophilia bacterium SCSIO 60948]|nr:MCE family protein [Thermoleophilia bacterium SCSIO 60948]